jgi:hypothetical protein
MDRIARLVTASGDLRRKIWASLPLRIRVAEFFTRLAVSTADAFGRTMFEIFAKHGVEGVPDPRGIEARQFGKKVFLNLMSKFHNPSLVEDVMSGFALRFLETGVKTLKKDSTLREAENYVLLGATREGLNALRSKQKKREESDIYVSEGEERRHDLPVFDEDTAEQQLRRMLPKVKHKLEAVHPDAPLYLKLSILDGHTDREILGDPEHGVPSLLPHPYGRQGGPLTERLWNTKYKPAIYAVLKDNFGDLQISV